MSSKQVGGQDCFARETLIMLADGTHKRIDHVQVGDRVLTEKGCSEVTEILCGFEESLMYFATSNACELRVTNNHPIKTDRGYVRAQELRYTDLIITTTGEAAITDLFWGSYFDIVYSLQLADSSCVCANQIFAADFTMQQEYYSLQVY